MRSNRRQELYDRIRESSMDEVTLQEMIRHGFWAEDDAMPSLPAEMIKRRGELRREISELAQDARLYRSQEQALRAIMKQKMREAKDRRIETKKRQIQARNDRAAAWHRKKTEGIVHLGDTVSGALQNRDSNAERLISQGLPDFPDLGDIADAMGITLGELRFLAYDRAVSKVSHYHRFQIPKKSGGTRILSAPMPRLKRAQYWLLDNIVNQIEPHDAAHGFRAGRSILTNAKPHMRQAVVVNYDLKDFFPSIGYRRVKGLFAALGYAEAQAAIFALLATEADRTEVVLDGQTWHVAGGERVLPQGAPTSPAITNLLCRQLDRRLTGTARKLGATYTRYADDLTFSFATDDTTALRSLDWAVGEIVLDEGFNLNDAKTRTMRRHTRQEVTGITVNDGLTISRKERRRFRAYLHNVEQGRDMGSFGSGHPKNSALGYAQFLTMVHGDGVSDLVAHARTLFGDQTSVPPEDPNHFRQMSARGEAPKADWWQPAEPAQPVPEALPQPPGTAEGRSTNIPTVGKRRARDWGAARAQPSQSGPARPRQGKKGLVGWSGFQKTAITVLALIALIPFPFSPVLMGATIYFIWFHRYRK
ncbi:reverse transcriptase family protein [Actibacterium sp. 188UL27-1]|uniref:reverse transcriptase family protein n=1 Tax=Actibacterium sp. 188UL27-1 TaxID=2786961 RepID=UPI00195EB83F|nr:reverse transcriptase family protein [Actibacterium sp. 188UL27-1]MBM7067288.1 RNA-directed DNA polymerase [Actibacterium sp. 188UL27-1]